VIKVNPIKRIVLLNFNNMIDRIIIVVNRKFLFKIGNMIDKLILKHREAVVRKNIYFLQINIYTWYRSYVALSVNQKNSY